MNYNLEGLGLNYCDSKHEAELEVFSAHASGLDVVILNPGIILGERDSHPHHHAIFHAMSKGKVMGVPPGGVTFSDITDVIDAHVSAIRQRPGGGTLLPGKRQSDLHAGSRNDCPCLWHQTT